MIGWHSDNPDTPVSFQQSLWLLSCLLAYFSAPTYPTVMAWSNHYLIPSSVVIAIIDLGIGAGFLAATWIGGLLIYDCITTAIFSFTLSFAALMVLITVLLQVYANVSMKAMNIEYNKDMSYPSEICEPDERPPLINLASADI